MESNAFARHHLWDLRPSCSPPFLPRPAGWRGVRWCVKKIMINLLTNTHLGLRRQTNPWKGNLCAYSLTNCQFLCGFTLPNPILSGLRGHPFNVNLAASNFRCSKYAFRVGATLYWNMLIDKTVTDSSAAIFKAWLVANCHQCFNLTLSQKFYPVRVSPCLSTRLQHNLPFVITPLVFTAI